MTFCCHWGLFNGTKAWPSLGVQGKSFGLLCERRRRHSVGRIVLFIPDIIPWFNGVVFRIQFARMFIECLFSHAKCIDRCWHPSVEDHLGYDLRNFLLRDTDM